MSQSELLSWAQMLDQNGVKLLMKYLTERYANERSRLDVMTRIRKMYLVRVASPSEDWSVAIDKFLSKLKDKPVAKTIITTALQNNVATENLYQQSKHKSIRLLNDLNNDMRVWKRLSKMPMPFPNLKDFRLDAVVISSIKQLNADALTQKTQETFNLNERCQVVYDIMTGWALQSKDMFKLCFGLLAVSGRRMSDIVYFANFEPTENEYELNCTRYVKSRGVMHPYTFPILIRSDEFLRQLTTLRKRIQDKFNILSTMEPRQVNLKLSALLNKQLRYVWEENELLKSCRASSTLNVHEMRSLYTILLTKSRLIQGHNPIKYLQTALNHKNLMSIQHYLTSAPNGPQIKLHGDEYVK